MQLKKIEIQGFKSFADKTSVEFLNGITTIVGPNGSGKSNISDAIRWVLGEQSIKSLRGSKMEDVIFSGTENRKRVGFAEVSLYLDNSDNVLPVEYSEVVLTRRLYRTGESGYYINNSDCRLKDIQELFMDTGIGKDGYSIISQGKIDEILSSKSEERRAIFEEASGIVKYRTRKDESSRKLENTNVNLSRVNDVLTEIEKNIGILEQKASVAKKYLNLKENLKLLDVKLFLKNVKQNAEKLSELNDLIETLQNDQKLEEDTAIELEKAKLNIKERLDEILNKLEENQTKYYEMENELDRLNYNINLTNEKTSNNKLNIERLGLEINQDTENIALLRDEIKKRLEKKESLSQNKIRFETELSEKTQELNSILSSMDEKELQKENLKNEVEKLNELKNELRLKNSSYTATINANLKQIENISSSENKNIYQKDSINTQKDDLSSDILKKNSELKKYEIIIKTKEEEISSYNINRIEISKKEQELKQEIMTLKSKYNYLNNLEHENEGYYKSVKSVLDYSKSSKLMGVYGTVASLISTSEKYEYAIEIALGGYVQNIVVETETDAKNLINYLKQNSYGRATFLPINLIKKYENDSDEKYKNLTGFLGLATDLVKYDKKYENVIGLALNKTIIVDNIDNAVEIAKKTKNSVKIVTLSGELISQTGSMTGGHVSNKTTGLIGRSEKILKLKSDIEVYEKELVKITSEVHNHDLSIKTIQDELISSKEVFDALKIELATLNEKYQNILSEISRLEKSKELNNELKVKLIDENQRFEQTIEKNNAEIQNIDGSINEKQLVIDEYVRFNKEKEKNINYLNEDIVNLKISLSSFDESVIAIEEMKLKIDQDISNFEVAIGKKKQQIEIYNSEIENNKFVVNKLNQEIEQIIEFKEEYTNISENLRKEKSECAEKQDILELKMLQSVNKVNKIKEEVSKVENKKVKFDIEIENLKNMMWNEYEYTISSAKQHLESLNITEIEDENIDKKAEKIRKEIKELGSVDVDSIEEYKTTKERYDFISTQKNDLEETKIKLENLIANMTSIMKQQFSKNFKVINENFSSTFKELFGGGRAELKLSDESNILESGIDIEVQPPGKKLQSMMLLSGGERALTATALLFAILKIKSPPFCILDEIEAALDDVNVHRFAEYIKKYSKDTQFIVITHRKGTMEVASSVYGVTMQEYGISKIISIKMV
ncbi:MAG: chromosome segregation protein SMC [Clostridia bacterium]|nr:chromosome segregation protein SMC [Clostridia bacterium]